MSVSAPPARPCVHSGAFLKGEKQHNMHLVLLNWALPTCTLQCWTAATYRICADGGANQLYNIATHIPPRQILTTVGAQAPPASQVVRPQDARGVLKPDLIVGDLDSVYPDVRRFYQAEGVAIRDMGHDQDTTDLEKAVRAARDSIGAVEDGRPLIVAVGALGGRLDHSLGSLSTLYKFPELELVLVGDGNTARLLPPGRNIIRVDRNVEGPTCGLVPLAGRAVVSSRGLRWDMDGLELEMGAMVSTSNEVSADEVEVFTDVPLVWTTACPAATSLPPAQSSLER
ncbi:unnamed protein product [Pedinophyceae sp. YPF-701]|nr:unnamed protein product [Pedinophyceae sp. YPF-701]